MNNWINVKNKLPVKGCWLIAFDHKDVITAGWDAEAQRFFLGCEYLNNVTHWMPLPEPPKDKS